MFQKYPKVKILGDRSNEEILTIPGKVVIQEKVDGANFGFYVEDNILYFCSHNNNLTDSNQIAKTGIPKRWKGIEPVLESFKNDPLMFDSDLYYYGESMQKHTLEYDNISGFIGFDIFDLVSEKFLNQGLCKNYFDLLDLPFIHTIVEIDTSENITLDYLKSLYQKSAYRDGSAEGIVIKRYDTQQMAKIVDDDFKEKYRQPKLKVESTNEQRIVDTYVTDARIEKMIHKLHDDNNEIDMTMVRLLFKSVIKDIFEEEIIEIYQNYNSINFKILTVLVSKRCVIVLKRVIMNG